MQAGSSGFEAGSLEDRYAFIDNCPPELFPTVATLPVGTLGERVAGVRAWNDALLRGQLPDEAVWPRAPIDTPVREALESMALARFCKDQPELVDQLMVDILQAFARQHVTFQSEVATQLKALEALERQRRLEVEAALAEREKRAQQPIQIDEATLRALSEEAQRKAAASTYAADAGMLTTWGERVRIWAQVAEVFGDLGEMLGRGWDLSLSVLKHTGWLDILRLKKLLETLPQLREIIQALGRLHATPEGPSVAETIMAPMCRLEEEHLEVRTPHVPAQMRGIERSDNLSRMLPVEAAMLGHPKLRFVWHARRAEQALLTYRVEGIELQRTRVEHEVLVEMPEQRPRPERGPIIAVIDTSGSMHGVPEQVAKALVLEAARTAHSEKRACFLYSYSGPGQILGQELDLSSKGLQQLLAFLGQSFGGGTDASGVTLQVLDRLQQAAWQKADVFFVSDGDFHIPPQTAQRVRQAREQGIRFHGVLVGSRGLTGMNAICDPVHVFQDWAKLGGWR